MYTKSTVEKVHGTAIQQVKAAIASAFSKPSVKDGGDEPSQHLIDVIKGAEKRLLKGVSKRFSSADELLAALKK